MRLLLSSLALTLGFSMPAFAELDDKVADRLFESAKILDELVNAPDGGIPADLLKKAECVAAIPAVKKAALGFGGRSGCSGSRAYRRRGPPP